MHNFNDLVNLIKKAAIEAVNASKPTKVVYGKVKSINPLRIMVEQKMILEKPQLVITKNFIDHEIEIILDEKKKSIKVNNSLKVNDEVVMIQVQGGQKYIVLDRMVK